MFLKLLKNDFIQTGRMFLWILAIGVAGGGIGALFSLTQEVGTGQLLAALLWNLLLIVGAFVLEIMGVVIILVSTNRSLFTERGYLTFALPVSSFQMLASKFITNVVFMLVSFAEVAGLVYFAFVNMRNVISKVGDSMAASIGMEGLQDAFSAESLGLPSFGQLMEFFGYMLLVMLVFLVLAMMIGLFVLTVSHVRPFQAKPALWIPIFLIASAVFCQQLVSLISGRLQININMNIMGEVMSVNMVSAIVMVALSAGLFFLTNWMLSRKISLK